MDLVGGTPLWPTSDGLPAVYPSLHHDLRCDVDWRWGGNGITFSWIAANLLLDRFLGRRNPDAEIFRFDR
jgi:hypothetical protein